MLEANHAIAHLKRWQASDARRLRQVSLLPFIVDLLTKVLDRNFTDTHSGASQRCAIALFG